MNYFYSKLRFFSVDGNDIVYIVMLLLLHHINFDVLKNEIAYYARSDSIKHCEKYVVHIIKFPLFGRCNFVIHSAFRISPALAWILIRVGSCQLIKSCHLQNKCMGLWLNNSGTIFSIPGIKWTSWLEGGRFLNSATVRRSAGTDKAKLNSGVCK